MNSLAQWGPIISAGATLFVGFMVALIAYRQWRVAHEKLIVDLFDKRFAVYNDAREAVRGFWLVQGDELEKRIHHNEQITKLHEVGRRARFLFGREVAEKIKVARDALIDATSFEYSLTPHDELSADERKRRSLAVANAHKIAAKFPEELASAVEKYMQITRAL
ncbi:MULTISPECIES: hypothetical protein [unclassified Mesorhizobium]|uniref:hypothetical protein n=1 Tax=unclassified Mesorhizobium TaxID=325217 RepID=UPI00109345ED|nr:MULTISPECIES: hypothetical protein [unclassified Mesorhizobium]TGS46404.1 hypothetical protein EN825_12450 [Mesorhizobium sp. M8A.F.Ca.ET.182.01.1.1]TGS81861.1 hypothetical protein EN824_12685 [Mesorhizobium sp. M8A.F.Ca.ET.181.01.1.1]